MKMTRALYNELKEAHKLAVTANYSGRNMFGKECFGLVSKSKSIVPLVVAFGEVEMCTMDSDLMIEASDIRKLVIRDYDECRIDSLGLDYIIYFPSIQVEAEVN